MFLKHFHAMLNPPDLLVHGQVKHIGLAEKKFDLIA